MRIVNIGSLNIDYVYDVDHFVERGETIASTGRNIFPGGKGLNQSIALGRAGAEVFHAGLIGSEGVYLCSLLAQSGVNTSHVHILDSYPTGHAVIQRDVNGDNCIVLYGGANACVDEAFIESVLQTCKKGDWILLQNETGALAYAISEASRRGMKIVLNPSPVNEALMECPLSLVDCFVLNEGEAMHLSGSSRHGIDLLSDMHNKFPRAQVVLTLGECGSMVIDHKGAVAQQKAYRVNVIDTTAAGDTFTGYFLAQMVEGVELVNALEIASMASALAVSRSGASPSIPVLSEVLEALNGVAGGGD